MQLFAVFFCHIAYQSAKTAKMGRFSGRNMKEGKKTLQVDKYLYI